MLGAEVLGVVAAAIQFADVGWELFLGMSHLLSDLNNTPHRMRLAASRIQQLVEIAARIKEEFLDPTTISHFQNFLVEKLL